MSAIACAAGVGPAGLGASSQDKTARACLSELLRFAGGDPGAGLQVRFQDAGDPLLRTPYKVASVGAATIAACGVAAAQLYRLRTGVGQSVTVSQLAAMAAMRSSRYIEINGQRRTDGMNDLSGFYQLRDGRWMYLHNNFFNIRGHNAAVLRCEPTREAMNAAVAQWEGRELEREIMSAGGCGAFVRSEAEWKAEPQFNAVAQEPLLEITQIGEAPVQPLASGSRPLSGTRVLDLTRVLAGPTCAKTLAEHGADVLRINRQDLADSGTSDFDTGIGKLSAYLDLRDASDRKTLFDLVRGCDVFSQAYRPGALAGLGFTPEVLAAERPGIVYTTLNAWGHAGPWASRRGYDTVVQAATGISWRPEGTTPEFMPASAQDYLAGYLLAFGTMVALHRRATIGGSWMVRTSLAAAGHWMRKQGLIEPTLLDGLPNDLPPARIAPHLMESDSPIGRLRHLAPVAALSATPAFWARPAVPLGTHPPAWPSE